MHKLKIADIANVESAAAEFITKTQGKKVFAFYGQMGAGKTTFIKEICRQLHVIDEVNSPTFAIINEYLTKANDAIFHFDFYRLKSKQEAVAIGAEDYFYSGNICFVEWPEIVEDLLPEDTLRVDILEVGGKVREVSF